MISRPTDRTKGRIPRAGLLSVMAFLLLPTGMAKAQSWTSGSGPLIAEFMERVANTFRVGFTFSPRYPVEGQALQLTDASTGGVVTWLWDFGDGFTSAEKNPVHVYTKAGFRRITLVAGNGRSSKRASRTVTVMPATGPATFVFSPATPGPGEAVQFTDTTAGGATSWQWTFGDGAASTAQNPTHAYAAAGSYPVTLIVRSNAGAKQGSRTVTVTNPPALTGSFAFAPASPTVGQTVQFTDTSTGTPTSWSWTFGDGTTSTSRNPSHAYATAGPKTVTLTVTNGTGSASATRTVTVAAAIAASFTFAPSSPSAGQTVQFTDTSTGAPTAWSWNFNDGGTSTSRNPGHAFAANGTFAVTLTASNASSSNSATQVVTVVTSPTLSASFTYSPSSPRVGQAVAFTDTSTGSPLSWSWSFGDGATSTSRNPSHTYAAAGSQTVTLTVSNGSGSHSASRSLAIAAAGSALIVDHSRASLAAIPQSWITQAKATLHIAYGHTSHGSQLTTGMTGLVGFAGAQYAYSSGGSGGTLDLRDHYGNFGNLGLADDLGSPSRTAWATATRAYLAQRPEINVIIWSWCGQVDGTQAEIQQYLDLMSGLERDFPDVKFVYMTGHTDGAPLTGNVPNRNKQIRDYCIANNKILYDFADIESYDPDGVYFGDKRVTDSCDYDSNGDGALDRNWAVVWQNANPGEWYNCEAAHTQPLNANLKAYAAWWLWARLAGWDGN
ncbi:MAG: PKD domain-containing protein [Acidobacteria bacterium]|nr:PKD domain-containing protein [Acidobacteriota bacterium]